MPAAESSGPSDPCAGRRSSRYLSATPAGSLQLSATRTGRAGVVVAARSRHAGGANSYAPISHAPPPGAAGRRRAGRATAPRPGRGHLVDRRAVRSERERLRRPAVRGQRSELWIAGHGVGAGRFGELGLWPASVIAPAQLRGVLDATSASCSAIPVFGIATASAIPPGEPPAPAHRPARAWEYRREQRRRCRPRRPHRQRSH